MTPATFRRIAMRVLKFRAIHFDDRVAIVEQNLSGALDNAGLAKT